MTDQKDPAARHARAVTPRRWGAMALVGATALGAGSAALAAGTYATPQPTPPARTILAQAATTDEGGEGGESGTVSPSGTDAAYLEALGEIDGHLRAAIALYREGRYGLAAEHVDSPDSDQYVILASEIAEHGGEGFAEELAALDIAADQSRPLPEVEQTYARLRARIDAIWTEAAKDPKLLMEATAALLRGAAADYVTGVASGAITDLGEYQDALGYTEVARSAMQRLATSPNQTVIVAAGKGIAALDTLKPAFDGMVPKAGLQGDAGLIYAAAAQIELAAYPLKKP